MQFSWAGCESCSSPAGATGVCQLQRKSEQAPEMERQSWQRCWGRHSTLLRGLVQHTYSSDNAGCFSAERKTFLSNLWESKHRVVWQQGTSTVSHSVAGKLLSIAEQVTGERQREKVMLRLGRQHLLRGPLVLGPFPGSTDSSELCWDGVNCCCYIRKCKTGTGGRHERKSLRHLTSLLQLCQDERAGSWLIPWTCLPVPWSMGATRDPGVV